MIIKFGIDPTGETLHIGHLVPLLRAKKYRDEGNIIYIVIGDFTARIGDPTGKNEARPRLSNEQIEENIKTIVKQVHKVLGTENIKIVFNSNWLSKVTLDTFYFILQHFTVQQIIERRMFKERIKDYSKKKGNPIWMPEFTYPILQGFDSYVLKANIEIGGQDQLFNMNVGRDIQKMYGMKQQTVETTPLILGGDGNKMSKTSNNIISLSLSPKEMFDALMSIRDDVAIEYGMTFFPEETRHDELLMTDIRKFKINLAQSITEIVYNPMQSLVD
ncbi:MAG: tyrosine--tRNA ligase [Patescibacteria group bacterium]|nr:tyrosine--tRNA ligase [Patescibacteria group bacterium]